MTNRKSYMGFRLAPRSMTLDDLNCYKFEFSSNFARVRTFGRQQRLNGLSIGTKVGGLGGTTGSASDSHRIMWVRFPLTQCVSQLSGKPPGVNCRLWPATTPSSEL